jgi:lipopolysaccharide/colanic/teichoic acid biosynthesis glycosyltransferase
VLRKAKLNELPQLLNVLCGDMSVIGPRPQAPANFDCFPDDVKAALKTVRPGLSGIGSIVFRDEEGILDRAADKTAFYAQVIAPYKGALELWYIRNRRPGTYLLLIALTAWVVAFPESRLHWRLLPGLPEPPPELADL